MKILFDHNVPLRLRSDLPGIDIRSTRQMRWETLSNGKLMQAAADAGFEAFLTIDKNIEYQQPLRKLPLAVVHLASAQNDYQSLREFAPALLILLATKLQKALYVIDADGAAIIVSEPRPKAR